MRNKVTVIAEAGVNHNGKLSLATGLIDAAKDAGADYVKFQTFHADKLVSPKTSKAGYQKKTTAKSESQYEMIKKLELSAEDHKTLFKYCRKKGIQFLSTPFDEESADFLEKIGMKIFKIPSGEITNIPFLQHIAGKKKPMILSTGMSTLSEVKQAVQTITKTGNRQLTILHCVTEYPTPFDQVNLRAIETLREAFAFPVGFSDHTLGIEAAIAAVGMGATVIEKHITLDRNLPGPDHKASLEPDEFGLMVHTIRHIEQALDDGVKRPMPCEKKYIDLVRKSVVAERDILKGEKINKENVSIKRPGTGIQPKDLQAVMGRKAKRMIKKHDVLQWKDVQ
jgi:N,N'-diacetyllegionaminate synthase